ncbi:aspartate:alanine exchanger family transporter [Streptomyces sp. NBC_01262]|uniref:aspartate:alanine exchanger family transporter n=1 Tax=Streptomyces sp. NBC_01262 TaxID=2903803 RepID=UPI002E364A68|nr:TrkA C-terminal domain-containing protein [Streptomyces sp. NBC_01262]
MVLDTLAHNPLLVLFLVAASGYLFGRISIHGFRLGVAGVLFAGIAAGALDARLSLPDIVYLLGLALFVYTMGLSTGPVFVSSLRRAGLRWNILALAAIATVAGAVVAVSWLLGLGGPKGAGFFTGVLTNTPALAAVVEKLHGHDAELPVVAYSLAYPVSVISSMIAISVLQRLWRIDYAADSAAAGIVDEQILNATAEVRRPLSVTDVIRASASRAIIGRVRHNEHDAVAEPDQRLEPGDLVTIVGTPKAVADATRLVGEASPQPLDADRSHLDVRRIFMSNPKLVGQCIDELQLADRFGAAITRVRREDTDMLAEGHTVLELGDRIRVVAPPERMKEVSRYFGDSYRELGELNIASLSLGLALGLLVGALSIPLPGGGHFSIGFAGGPLVVGLLLGARRRTGPLVWQLPTAVNTSLRQIGLVLFLAGIGTRAGHSFASTITTGGGWLILGSALVLCLVTAFSVLLVGHKLLGLPMGVATGVLAGLSTQPATLVFASEQSGNGLPELGYATVFPAAMLTKILLAQLLLSVLIVS